MDLDLDPHSTLAATRFATWTSLAAISWLYSVNLWQSCRFRFWNGTPYDRALLGWVVESVAWSWHQAWWWAVEQSEVMGKCAARDPLSRAENVYCAQAAFLRTLAPYVTPIFYVGIVIGLVLVAKAMLMNVTGLRVAFARLATISIVAVLWFVGLALTGAG